MERQVGEGLVNSEMNRPRLDHEEGVSRGFGDSAQGVEPMSVDQCDSMREIEDSRIVGAPVTLAGDAEVLAREQVPVQMVLALEAVRGAAARNSEESIRKPVRGRPPRSQRRSTPAQPPPRRRRDEEDVCFICFDGGSLVLCDRRGCPKAYHPACIKRDESFFRSKARWNCGWHICSSCQKASHYMCYTCTFSLCKACTKDADYLCVRGDKGFCGTCMRTVMLIENIPIGNKEAVQVDFDDKGNWEYLFKVYWIYLKQKLSLTVEELTKAKNPWKAAVALPPKVESPGGFYNNNDEKVCRLDNSCRNLEANNSKRRKTRNQPYLLNQGFGGFGKSGGDGGRSLSEGMPWATKELSEFVAYMKNGDSSMLSQFDVQALLLEYIKRNDLRDPGQKCQIICDSRLKNLFGKERVGHFEMLKLLEYHFLIKENVPANHIADPITGNGEAAESNDNQLTINNDRKHKTRKKSDGRGVQSNPNEYAAIDVHNINLLYMKRNLMENLLDDAEKFHDIVSGSIVRIRIPVDQKQDMYRLVQVIGTSKVAESHKVGTRTTDVKLEILNLDKKEVVSIDEISNQEFSEDECKCLRQSIKCGHIQRLIVGEIQKKAIALWAVRVEECLEAEVWKLSHLRDRASEKGHRKELRECVEKLELLNSLEERQRRLNEIPEVHADPSMDPSYESEENDGKPDEKKQDAEDLVRRGKSVVVRKIVEEKSPGRETSVFNNIGSRGLKNLGTAYDQSRNTTFYVDKDGTTLVHEPVHASTWNEGGESFDSNNWTQPKNQVGPASSVTSTWNDQDALQSELHPWVASESSLPPCSTVTELSVHDFETERLWHYQDPAGNIQGPFSMLQLHKWSTSGHFPSDLRVWRINEKQEDSILLSDAFNGQHSKVSVLICNKPVLPVDVSIPSDGAHKIVDAQCENSDATRVDNEKVEVTWSSMQNDTSIHNNSDNESARSNKWSSHSSSWTRHAHPAPCNQKTEGSLIGLDLPKDIESRADQPQSCTSLPSPTPSEELRSTPSLQVMEGCEDEKRNASPGSVTINPPKTTGSQSSIADGSWKLADGESYSGQASGQGLGPPPINCSSNGLVSGSGIVSLTMSLERSQQKQENHFPDFPCATPKNNQGGSEGQATENKQSMSLSVHVLDSGPSWCGTSSLLGGELQLPEVPGDGFVGSPTQTRPSVDEWGSNLVSSSSLRPIEVASDYAATPASVSSQPTHSSAAHLADASSWQPFVHEPTEFCSLPGESVSDLLAEVEAMEALDHLSSPTSSISCGGEFRDFTEGTENDCFSPVEGFSPIPEQRRSDALSSSSNLQIPSHGTVPDESSGVAATFNPTGDLQMPHQSTVTNESLGVSPIATLDPQKRSGGHVSLNAEVQGDAKPRAASVNGWEAGADVKHHPVPSSSEVSEGTILGRTSSGGGGQPQENANFELGISQGSGCHNNDANSATSTGNASSCGYQSRHVTERLSGQRDRNSFYNRDSGFGKARNFRNRQAAHGGVNGGGSFRPLPKGHRVCKFYESGHCKKGASCSYRHP